MTQLYAYIYPLTWQEKDADIENGLVDTERGRGGWDELRSSFWQE